MSTEILIGIALLVCAIAGLLAYRFGLRRGKATGRKRVVAPGVCGIAKNGIEHDFTDKVAVITGGGTGLGRSIALSLARRGAKLVIASRSDEHLQAVKKEIETLGGEVLTHSFDVRDPEQVDHMVNAAIGRFGKIDILVNNAAGNFVVPAEELSVNGWNAVIGIVLNGTWYCSSAVGKKMLEQGQGSILNIVANYATTGYPGVVHSAAAKAAVLNMSQTLAVEWGYKGVRVNAFAPGTMPSKGASGSRNLNFTADGARQKIEASIPLGRLTDSDEMAELAVLLLSDQASYVNGSVFTADGGAWLPKGFLDLQEL